MPFWSRFPRGIYSRDTPDYWAKNRARASITFSATAGYNPAVALWNNSTPAAYFHVIGLALEDTSAPQTLFGKFIGGALPPNPNGDTALIGQPISIYSDQPMPPGQLQFGQELNPNKMEATIYDIQGPPAFFYNPPWEIVVIAPNTGWELYSDLIGGTTIMAVIDYVILQD
jgi:hypothetical protein